MRAVNLIPAEQRSGSAVGAGRSEGAAYAVIAVVAGIAVLALLYGMARHDISSRRDKIASVTVRAQQAQAAASQLAPFTSFIALREQREQTVAQLVDSRFDWAHAFHEFGRVLPTRVSISSLSGSIGSTTSTSAAAPAPATRPTPTTTAGTGLPSSPGAAGTAAAAAPASSATPPGSVPTFTLTGCATSQPVVAEMLERLRLIDGVSDVTLQSSTKSSATSGGSCPAESPVFSVQITYDALPSTTAAAAAASTKTVADVTGAARTPATPGGSSK
jgi:Tfp pilus assembly protein PilN